MLSEEESKVITGKITFTGRSYRNLDFDTLSDELKLLDWSNFAENYTDKCWNIMSDGINTVIDKLCPLKDFKFAKDKSKWLSDVLIELMKNRDNALKLIKTEKDEDKIEMVNVAVRIAIIDYM